jgi:hypothetical protein
MTERGATKAGVAAAALAALAACAGAAEQAFPPAARFRDVRSLLLVRERDARDGRGKDPLDGLEETLRARGFAARVVELGRDPPPGQAALERLFRELEVRASASRAERIATPVRDAGRDAAAAVAQLGVDAVATYHRLERPRPVPPLAAFSGGPAAAAPPPALPLGALVLLDRAGRVATFAWGDAGALEEPGVPLNAAEAIEQLVRALTGEQDE